MCFPSGHSLTRGKVGRVGRWSERYLAVQFVPTGVFSEYELTTLWGYWLVFSVLFPAIFLLNTFVLLMLMLWVSLEAVALMTIFTFRLWTHPKLRSNIPERFALNKSS